MPDDRQARCTWKGCLGKAEYKNDDTVNLCRDHHSEYVAEGASAREMLIHYCLARGGTGPIARFLGVSDAST